MVLVEKKHFPREKTCGDGLTPRSVRQLEDMGLAGALAGAHRYNGLRAYAFGAASRCPGPSTRPSPATATSITRHDLDDLVAERAAKAGAIVWEGTEAVEPLVDEAGAGASAARVHSQPCAGGQRSRTRVRRHDPHRVRARYMVVADGANSRFGRALGTSRDRTYRIGMALRGLLHARPATTSR